MQWKLMTKTEASGITSSWQAMNADDFEKMVETWTSTIPRKLGKDYLDLRNEVLEAYQKAVKEVGEDESLKDKRDYQTDLKFAVYLYRIMKRYGFSVRLASNDQIWIYLCVSVFPDIVQHRYPGSKLRTHDGETGERNVNEDRFWKVSRRIYLKVLWWYIYLSMQKDEAGQDDLNATYEILKDNTTDEIVQLVERSGSAGYRVDVCREIMKFYSDHRSEYDAKRFRRVMVLNTARTRVVEPALMKGGIHEYVKELFVYFD